MTNSVYSVRLDDELASWVKNQTNSYKRESDVIREAIICAMEQAKNQDTLMENAAKKSITLHHILKEFIANFSPNGAQILDKGAANGLKEIYAITSQNQMIEPCD